MKGNRLLLLLLVTILGLTLTTNNVQAQTCEANFDIRSLDMVEEERDTTDTVTTKTMRLELAYVEVETSSGGDLYVDMETAIEIYGPYGPQQVPLPADLQGLQKVSDVYKKFDEAGMGGRVAQIMSMKVMMQIQGCTDEEAMAEAGESNQGDNYGCDSHGGEGRDGEYHGEEDGDNNGEEDGDERRLRVSQQRRLKKKLTSPPKSFRNAVINAHMHKNGKTLSQDEIVSKYNHLMRKHLNKNIKTNLKAERKLNEGPPPYMAYPMPPFGENVVSQFFQYFPPGGEHLDISHVQNAHMKYTPFTSATDVYDSTSGSCKLMVTLSNETESEELVSVDSVNYECMKAAFAGSYEKREHNCDWSCDADPSDWENYQNTCCQETVETVNYDVPGDLLGLNVYTMLQTTTGAAPGRGEILKIVTKQNDGTLNTRYAEANYANYRKLKASSDQKRKDAYKLKCWKDYEQRHWFGGGYGGGSEQSGPPAQCGRSGTQRKASGKTNAIERMSPSKYPFVVFNKKFNLETGKISKDMRGFLDWDASKAGTKTCTLQIYGLKDKNGNNVCMQPMTIGVIEPKCNIHQIKNVTKAMAEMLADVKEGKMASSWEALMQYTGTDTWFACSNLILDTIEMGKEIDVSEETAGCIHDYPHTCTGTYEYCKSIPGLSDPWCTDPCCNWDLSYKMCCAPTTQTFKKKTPKVNTDKIADLCMDGSSEESLKVATTVVYGQQFVEASLNPEGCFAGKKLKEAKLAKLDDIVECCVQSVIGEIKQDSMMGGGGGSSGAIESNQKCSNNGDCYSGSCANTQTNTGGGGNNNNGGSSGGNTGSTGGTGGGGTGGGGTGGGSSALKCFTVEEESGKTFKCNLAKKENQGAAMAKCILKRLENEGMDKPAAFLRKKYANGDFNAADSVIGDGIIADATRSTCLGRSGWRFDPDNWCQDYIYNSTTNIGECVQNCESEADCKPMCLADSSCNHNPSKDDSNCADNVKTHFCAETTPWGDIWDTTEYGFCKIGSYHNKWHFDLKGANPAYIPSWCKDHAGGCDEWSKIPLLTDANCSAIDPTSTTFAIGKQQDWDHEAQKEIVTETLSCGYTAGNADTDKSVCLDQCKNSNGPQPVERYGCVLPYDDTNTGGSWSYACDSDGGLSNIPNISGTYWWQWQDWKLDLPWFVERPKVCLYEWCSEWSRNGKDCIKTAYPTSASATEACMAEFGPTASAKLIQSSDDKCQENLCFNPDVTTESECNGWGVNSWRERVEDAKTSLGLNGHFYPEWKSDYAAGAGRCFLNRHSWNGGGNNHGWGDGDDWSANLNTKLQNRATNKQTCELLNGTHYVGRTFQEGKRDSQTKCTQPYCNLVGPEYSFPETECLKLPGECDSWNCKGCEQDWEASGEGAICYNVTSSSTECTSAGHTYDSEGGFCYKTENIHDCNTPFKLVSQCRDLDFNDCSGSSESPNSPLKFRMSEIMGCKQSGRTMCKNKHDCETQGDCWGGASMRSDYKGEFWPYVCVREKTTYGSNNWLSCDTYKQGCNDGDHWCWDENVEENMKFCVDLYQPNQTACDSVAGTWTSTEMTQTSCLAEKQCQTKQGWMDEKSETECTKCGGTMVSANTFHTGKWKTPAMVSSTVEWKLKQMESENQWISQIDKWKLSDSIQSIKDLLMQEASSTFTSCLYGRQGSSLEKIAGACGSFKLPRQELIELLSEPTEIIDVSAVPAEEQVGVPDNTNLKVEKNTTSGEEVQVKVNTQTFIPPTEAEQEETAAQTGRRLFGHFYNAAQRRLSFRSLETTEKKETTNSASCYSTVVNSKGFVIGQLVGDCIGVNLPAGKETFNADAQPELCIETRTTIEKHEKFTVPDFGNKNESTYTPLSFSVTVAGKHYCAKIPAAGVYCPIRRIANYEAATEDEVENKCPALDAIVQDSILAKKCKMGDRKSCKWFERGSLSEAAAVISVLVIVILIVVGVIKALCCFHHRHTLKKHFSKAFFAEVDADHDGKLDANEMKKMVKHEFNAVMSIAQCQHLIQIYDVKKIGGLDLDEYKAMMVDLKDKDEHSDKNRNMKELLEEITPIKGNQIQPIESPQATI